MTSEAWHAATALGLRTSGARGDPEFSGLEPGHYTVLVMVPSLAGGDFGVHRADAEVAKGEQTLRIVLPQTLRQLAYPRPKGR